GAWGAVLAAVRDTVAVSVSFGSFGPEESGVHALALRSAVVLRRMGSLFISARRFCDRECDWIELAVVERLWPLYSAEVDQLDEFVV
ncbi:hypothetical protein N7326_09085, partial [Corynebacterium sp. ES2794-CONJ1]|uniref:hypothetical protein n=1 Tax=Corynebacterium sp. ES2794-CONJ1 TaxID=2980553 RepID=UPI0021DB63D8